MSDGAALQSIMGPPEGHRQARDEAGAEAAHVGLPEGLRREDHHFKDRPQTHHQQVTTLTVTDLFIRKRHQDQLHHGFRVIASSSEASGA